MLYLMTGGMLYINSKNNRFFICYGGRLNVWKVYLGALYASCKSAGRMAEDAY